MFVTDKTLLLMSLVCLIGASLIVILLVRTVENAIKFGPWTWKFKVNVPDDVVFEAVELEAPPDADVDVELPPFLAQKSREHSDDLVEPLSHVLSVKLGEGSPSSFAISTDQSGESIFKPITMSTTLDLKVEGFQNDLASIRSQLQLLQTDFNSLRGTYWSSVNYGAGNLSPSIIEMIGGLEKNIRELRAAVRAVKPIIVREKDVIEKKGKKKK